METVNPHPCEKCGQSFTDQDVFVSHLCSESPLTSAASKGQSESNKCSHIPEGHLLCTELGCTDQCQSVSGNTEEPSEHMVKHNHPSTCAQDTNAASATEDTSGSHQPRFSSRTKRKLKYTPTYDGTSERPKRERHRIKRVRKVVERENPPAVGSSSTKSKEYIAEGAENIYRTHTCPICRRCFKMRSHLQEHLHLHFPDPSLQCPTCKRYFTSKSKLRIHRLREAGEKVHRCHLCDYSAVERNAVRRHFVSMHADEAEDGVNSQSYPCPTCGESFRQSRSLKAHMKMHNILPDTKPVSCFHEECSFQSSLRRELLRHTVEVHGIKAVECRHHACGAIFPKESDMEAHYQTHLAYHCSHCDFSCSNKTVFLQHQRHGHPGSDQLCCDFCSFVTFNPVEFEHHIGHLHANEKIHRCSQCSYVTSHKRGLKRHMLMHSGEKPHKCSLCDFRCRDESYLSKHMLTHSDDKNFMCTECGYVTKWKHYLNVHMRKHAGDLRYQCDQCPYRCHRMDQLNSHKLRHQAKSLMCEICAYACKRKYELRNHMLAKHSGEEKQPSVYKCKYCTYTTSYRQALQNHENCKHTKLKQFRCALCFYSSFSSISLFLHKKKVHGYVPGDKAWLENYAAKEKERNSTEFLQDFYNKRSTADEQSTEGRPPSHKEQTDLHSTSKETVSGSHSVDTPNVFHVVSQEIINEGISDSPPTVNSPEEYCTLILTTLSTTEYQTSSVQNAEENGVTQTQEKADFISSSEEYNVAAPHVECELSDLDHSDESVDNSTRQPVKQRKCQTSEVESNSETVSSVLPPEQSQSLESEVRIKAMKKHDKDQAEAMVLEGRVQMLVVPTKDIYRCDNCAYVTFEQAALKHHCQSFLCRGKIKEHECQACGARFKQRRSLDSHRTKKCPTLPQKTRTFGMSNISPAAEESCSQGDEACASTKSGHQKSKTQIDEPLTVKSVKQVSDRALSLQEKALYSKKDGKFKCELCSYSSVKLTIMKRHLSTCQKKHSQGETQILSDVDGSSDNGSAREKEDVVDELLSCPACAFKCKRKTGLESHKKRGCVKLNDTQSTSCLFVDKSKSFSLTRHILHKHKRKKLDIAKLKSLHCQHCAFTCKQERRLAQHVALKHKGVRPHRCRYCPFATTRHYRLEEHESLHTGIGRHKCDLCNKTFGAMTKLRQHKMRIHDKQPKHLCSSCDFGGYTLDDVRRHNLRCHTGELEHACAHCDSRFSSEIALRNHCKRVHQLQVCLSCDLCDYTCSSKVTLKTHQQNEHRQVKCTSCQASFETNESLEIHQRSHLTHQCQLCSFAAKTRQLLAQHLLSEHEGGSVDDKPLKCSSCQFACRHQLVLERHLRSHGGKRLYKCTDCEYSTHNKQKITWHIRIHTGEKPYSCELCTYTCTDPSRLKLHMRVHQEEKKYLCPECGYKCKWATQLKYHMTKHTGEKPHACDKCDYRTNRADALRAHRDTQHCDVRPYVCEKCGKAFKTSFILKTHQRQHSDDRPYTCGLCQKAFRWPAGLRHHYLSHTKQQPFCCRHCSYRAKQKFQVVKHLHRHHPEMSIEDGVVRDSGAVSLTLKEALQGTLDDRAADVGDKAVEVAAVVRGGDSETKH